MKILAAISLFAAVILGASAVTAQDALEKEHAKLIGVWVGYAVKGKGENPERSGGPKIELTITKDTIRGAGFKGKDKTDLGLGTFTIDAKQMPIHLDGDKKIDNPNR